MFCPGCQSRDFRVVDSRTTADAIRRRRECANCGERFTTFERLERRIPWITKKDGRKELFSREKVLQGIALACRNQGVSPAMMDEAVSRVEAACDAHPEPTTEVIGQAVMDELRTVDEVAYVRFVSVYRRFESVEQFVELIRPMQVLEP